ncbi:LysR family transcriptional regulator [Leeia sp. TBRC 13508]|uniref:LysR family transcriptional regulator n=1 Tax=Leeia speluncae TaxID=2884804 RepID=A0ABS8D9K7_9NEIS|nr:LysR substrate-binding domain-containing protein [Leeia speluncae]MCB6184812.1 LysR family transcriptional regulator [Leeia speluncae]
MNWTLDQLVTFVTTVDSGSFSAAARKLGRAQSAISTAIGLLESSLGVSLFDRSTKIPTLTNQGKSLLPEAREILRQCDALNNQALILGQAEVGRVTFAMDEGLPYPPALALLSALAKPYPQIELNVLHGSQENIVDWLQTNQADIALGFHRKPVPPTIESVPVSAVPRIMVCGHEHPLAGKPKIQRRQLARYRQLILSPNQVDEDEEERISPQVWRANSLYAVAELARLNLGWGVLPVNIVQYPTLDGKLVELSSTDLFFPALEVRLYWRSGQGESEVLRWIRQYLQTNRFTHIA